MHAHTYTQTHMYACESPVHFMSSHISYDLVPLEFITHCTEHSSHNRMWEVQNHCQFVPTSLHCSTK